MSKNLSPPIFLLGCPRSGTTLMVSYMGRHAELHALPETQFFRGSFSGPAWKRRAALRDPAQLFDYVWTRNPRLQDVDLDVEALRADFTSRSIYRMEDAFSLVLEHALEGTGKSRIVEKTPRHLEHVGLIRKWFPKAPVICLLRDGRDTVNSLLDARWTHDDADRHITYWRWCVRRAIQMQAAHPDHIRIIRFEDFISDPEAVLREICSFSDVPFSEEMLDVSQRVHTVPEWEATWKGQATKAASRTGLEKWRNDSDEEKIRRWSARMAGELQLLGYPLDGVAPKTVGGPSPLMLKLRFGLRNVYHTHLADHKIGQFCERKAGGSL